jgi:hypothetical protein
MPEALDHPRKRLPQPYSVLKAFLSLLPRAFLLLDHLLALITIIWLLVTTLSYYQLLDQSVIIIFKLYYYKMWVVYMIREYNAERDPDKIIRLLQAIWWSVLV